MSKRLTKRERDDACRYFCRGVVTRVNEILEELERGLHIVVDPGKPLRCTAGCATFWHMSFRLYLHNQSLALGHLSPVLGEVLDYRQWINPHAMGVLKSALRSYSIRRAEALKSARALLERLQHVVNDLNGQLQH